MTTNKTLRYFQNYASQKPALDLRLLIITNVVTSTIVLVSPQEKIVFAAFIVSLTALLLFQMFWQAFVYAFIFFLTFFYIQSLPLLFENQSHMLQIFFHLLGLFSFFIQKLISFVMFAHIIFVKIPVNYLVASLRRMYLHKGILLSVVVAFRYLPTAKAEFTFIKNAMRLRGIELGIKNFIKNPLHAIEFSLVPLLFRSLTVADEMSAAATVKGIEFADKAVSLLPIRLQMADYFFILYVFSIFGLAEIYCENEGMVFFITHFKNL